MREVLPMKLATSAQMRELDRKAIEERHVPSIDLMERAAAETAQAALDALYEKWEQLSEEAGE